MKYIFGSWPQVLVAEVAWVRLLLPEEASIEVYCLLCISVFTEEPQVVLDTTSSTFSTRCLNELLIKFDVCKIV